MFTDSQYCLRFRGIHIECDRVNMKWDEAEEENERKREMLNEWVLSVWCIVRVVALFFVVYKKGSLLS